MAAIEEARLRLVLSVEKFALVARNLALALIAVVAFTGHLRGVHAGLAAVAGIVIVHTAFSLWTYLSGRHEFFRSPWNFLLNLVEITLTVAFTGGPASVLYVFYLFFIVALSAYTRSARQVLFSTGLCLVAFGGVVLLDRAELGLNVPYGLVFLKFSAIAAFGWLVARVTRVLARAEESSAVREASLAASEATLRMILDSAADPIFVYGDDECITEVNSRACSFLAVPRCKLLGQRMRAFLFDDGTLPGKMAQARARGEYHGEQIFVDAYGEERTVDLRVRSYARDGQRYFVAVGPDVTERKNLQEATRLANQRLEKLNQELTQVNALRRGLLATVSQRLRSPLTALLGYLDMLIDDELGELAAEQRNALHTCRRATLRAFDLIDEALDVSESGAPSTVDQSGGSARPARNAQTTSEASS